MEPAKSSQSSSSVDAPVSALYPNLTGQLPPSTQLRVSPFSASSPPAAAGARLRLHPTRCSRGGIQPLMIRGTWLPVPCSGLLPRGSLSKELAWGLQGGALARGCRAVTCGIESLRPSCSPSTVVPPPPAFYSSKSLSTKPEPLRPRKPGPQSLTSPGKCFWIDNNF